MAATLILSNNMFYLCNRKSFKDVREHVRLANFGLPKLRKRELQNVYFNGTTREWHLNNVLSVPMG